MNILALDTSSDACSIAISVDNLIFTDHVVGAMQQAQLILPAIHGLLSKAGIKLNDLTAIAFGCGPGRFTGLRIGVSVSQAIAYAAGIPLVSISSHAALAQGAYRKFGILNSYIAVDAKMKEVYWSQYKISSYGLAEPVGEEIICPPENLDVILNPVYAKLGDAWHMVQSSLHFIATHASITPEAQDILPLAKEKFFQQKTIKPANAYPTYLRMTVTTPPRNNNPAAK